MVMFKTIAAAAGSGAYPILGIASIGAARVELAVAKLGTPEQFYAFHRKIYTQRERRELTYLSSRTTCGL
jgi:protein-disulfide isomerase